MIWIIGGTGDANDLLAHLQNKLQVVVTVATETGKAFVSEKEIVVGRMNTEEMRLFLQTRKIRAVVDLSHPYAIEVSENARKACGLENVPYFRFSRKRSETQGVVLLPSLESCLNYLQDLKGCVFFTTGSKNIAEFEKVKGNNRFVYRVLPAVESLEICRQQQVALADIVAALGPFSLELNLEIFKAFATDFVVMKNSGRRGGTAEKIQACQTLGITPIMIDREDEPGYTDLNELANFLLKRFANGDDKTQNL